MILGQGSRDTSAYVTTTTEVENNGAKGGQEGVQGIGGQNSNVSALLKHLNHGQHLDSKLKGQLDKLIEKLKASPAADKELNASHLRDSISSHNVNLGVLAAFMTALAAAIYVSPPSEPKCFGEIAIGIQLVLEWIAMGCFFITIITTVVICSDLEGVPNHLLLLHLQRPSVSTVYDLPALTTWIGVFFMAFGYGIDINERIGGVICNIYFGYWAAPMFAVSTISILLFLKGKRKELNEFHKSEKIVEEKEGNNKSGEEYEQDLGRKYFSPWHDIVPRSKKKKKRKKG